MPAMERVPVAKTREEILAQPREQRKCSKCGQVSGFWLWTGFKLIECRDCTAEREAQDVIEIRRMMGQRTVRVPPKSRVLERRRDDDV